MANDDAWSSGWAQGSGEAQKKKDKKDASSGSSKAGIKATGSLPKMHSGGKVKRTGNYRLRKGETVLTVSQQKEAGIKTGGKKKSSVRKRVASKG